MTVITSAAAAEAPSTPTSPRRRRSPASSSPPPFARLFLLVTIAVCSSRAPPFVEGGSGNTVEVQDNDDDGSTYIYHESHARSSTYEEYYRNPEENGTAFLVKSDVPVSILRYNDDVYLHGETPIDRGDVYVIVKGNCSRMGVVDVDGNEFGINVTYGNETRPERDRPWHNDGDVSSVNVGVSPYDPPSSPFAFLKASTFLASWNFYGGWFPPQGVKCPEDVSETTSRGTGGGGASGSGAAATGSSARRAIGTALAAATAGYLLLFSRDRPIGTGMGGRFGIVALTVLLAIAALSCASEYQQHQNRHAGDGNGGSPTIIKRATQAVEVEGGPPTPSEEENCVVNVEVLVDGCAQPLRVSAPAVRVLDVAIRDQKQSWPSSVPGCGPSQHTALLKFPDENVDVYVSAAADESTQEVVDVTIPRLLDDVCMRAVMGRPFVESSTGEREGGGVVGAPIRAEARFIDSATTDGGEDSREWSRRAYPSQSLNVDDDPKIIPTERVATDSSIRDEIDGNLATTPRPSSSVSVAAADAQDWANRGLGEHSSVASFAIHAVALMSNGAPPDLVRDALRAALDEVDHAVTSFGVASELMGGIVAVEPGPLPPTNHAFGRDLVGLATSTAREGCVEETLSALEVAHEADDRHRDGALRKTLEKIALDEARHSALAWRTVGWACGMDPTACDAVEGEVLGGLDGVAARRGHSPNGAVATGWQEIHRTLVPVVLAAGKGRRGGDDGDRTVECDGIDSVDSSPLVGRTVVERVVEAIIGGVLCASGTDESSAASE